MEWKQEVEKMAKGTMMEALGMEILELEKGRVVGKMPVDERTVQPFKVLHGGASAAFAETLGSLGSYVVLKDTDNYAVGLELNANHIRPASSGFVYGEANLIHGGRTTHIWEIKITNEEKKLVCASRLTMIVKQKQ